MLGIYCRISVEKEEGIDRSINDQMQSGIELAKKKELEYEVYIDRGYSGDLNTIEQRPSLYRMTEDILGGKLTSVYVYDQSRLERNPQVRLMLNDILRGNNISLFTSTGIIDLNDMQSQLIGDIVSVMNQHYVRLTKKKIKSVLHRNVKEGKAHSSIYPYGYCKDDNNFLIIEEEEAEIVKRIYKDSLNGIGTNKIAENLDAENIPTRYNKIGKGVIRTKNIFTGEITTKEKKNIKWSGNSVRGILKNTIYKGQRNFGGEIYDCSSIALFETSYWQKVNDNLKKNRNNSGKKVEHKYLLKGILECGVCGRNMYGRTRQNKHDHYYMCSSKRHKDRNCGNRSINIDFIEKFIWEVVLEDAYVINELEKERKEENIVEKLNKEKEIIEKQISTLKKQISNINNLAIEGGLEVNEVIQEKKNRNFKIDELKTILNNLNDDILFELKAIKLRKTIGFDKNKIKSDTPFNKRQELISKYISRVLIRYDKTIKFYYIGVRFKTKTCQQNYAFSSNPNRMKRFISTGEHKITKEEKELIINGIEIDSDIENEYFKDFSTKSRSSRRE